MPTLPGDVGDQLAQRGHAWRLAALRASHGGGGADALELNVYALATDAREDARPLEDRTIEMVREVLNTLRIPLAVELSLFYTSFANFAHRLDETGTRELILFFKPSGGRASTSKRSRSAASSTLSDSSELPLRLRWLAILLGNVHATLAVTGGVHTVLDVIQPVMARGTPGADGIGAAARCSGIPRQAAARARAVAQGPRVRVASRDAGRHEYSDPQADDAPTTCSCCRAGNR